MNSPRSRLLLCALVSSLLSVTAYAKDTPCYRITRIAVIDPFEETNFFITDLNDKGEVVGGRFFKAFLWRDGQIVDLPPPFNGTISFAATINRHSDIAGTYQDAQFQSHAALLRRDGTVIELHAIAGEGIIVPLDMNNHRQILGASFSEATGWQDFIWHRGQVTLLERLPNDSIRQAAAINDHGVATGSGGVLGASFAVLWPGDGTVMQLPRPDGAEDAFASDINNRGQVLVNGFFHSIFPGSIRPYIWDDGEITVLGLPYADQTDGGGNAMNDRGFVVGETFNSRGGPAIATLWRHGSAFDLDTLICANDPLAGQVHLFDALEINNRNEIVAVGTEPGQTSHFFLTPKR